ncbi:rho GTPase-activating protein 44-like isoform X5 [Gigantopelta aegis]|uniref:rho GTPase-activating protein 44-like isoform X5 n=1 Tax=Gigantopelta aegis TaxID=1735272 RepID=UPI001B88A4BC|nr:rho GTPase-activating protein 44-like isoform X5 [Gigantopelta aegis]
MWKKENLRKNFLRIRQIADQNLGRAEKSEVLSDELLSVEKRVDVVKTNSAVITKKISLCLQAQGVDIEKRLKKLPETSLAHSLIESAGLLGDETLLGQVCHMCGECESTLARERLQYEINVERDVLQPLQSINEVDIPAIMKVRRHLNKATLDMDSAKGRFNSAVRQSNMSGQNFTMAAAKADTIKDEYDEASNKVENIKDALAVEMSNFIAKETDHSSKLLALLEAQEAYHKKALEAIKTVIPKMKAAIDNCPTKPVYGMSLTEHLRVTGRDIAVVLEACIRTLLETAMEEEGLFRIAGGAMKLKKLKACFDANIVDMMEFSTEPHVVAGALKQYLRELPEPLLTFQLHSEFMQAAQLPQNQQLQAFWTVISKLPKQNYDNFRYLVKFLSLLCEKSEVNKMTPSNVAIVIGPNLLWSKGESAPNMLTTGTLSAIIEAVVMHADWFFPGDFDFADVGESPLLHHYDNPLYESPTAATPTTNSVQQPPTSSSPQLSASPNASPSSSTSSTHTATDNTAGSSISVMSSSADNNREEQVSPKMLRRQTRKQAPPPPPDRPYSVAVTATVSTRPTVNQSSTWPRNAPLASPESPSEAGGEVQTLTERVKPLPSEKSHPHHDRPAGPPPEKPEKPERPMGPPPARPSIPPTNHQRSLSTGANINLTPAAAAQDSSSGQGSLNSSPDSLNKETVSSLTSHLLSTATPSSDMHANSVGLPRAATASSQSMRVASRPIPPPPPPPINKSTEETHL